MCMILILSAGFKLSDFSLLIFGMRDIYSRHLLIIMNNTIKTVKKIYLFQHSLFMKENNDDCPGNCKLSGAYLGWFGIEICPYRSIYIQKW